MDSGFRRNDEIYVGAVLAYSIRPVRFSMELVLASMESFRRFSLALRACILTGAMLHAALALMH